MASFYLFVFPYKITTFGKNINKLNKRFRRETLVLAETKLSLYHFNGRSMNIGHMMAATESSHALMFSCTAMSTW